MESITKVFKAIGSAASAILIVSIGTAILFFGAPIFAIIMIVGGCTLGFVVITISLYQSWTAGK